MCVVYVFIVYKCYKVNKEIIVKFEAGHGAEAQSVTVNTTD